MEGADHKASLLPSEFKRMVEGIKQINEAIGSQDPRNISQAEMINQVCLSKSLAVNCSLKQGQTLRRNQIVLRSPELESNQQRLISMLVWKLQQMFRRVRSCYINILWSKSAQRLTLSQQTV